MLPTPHTIYYLNSPVRYVCAYGMAARDLQGHGCALLLEILRPLQLRVTLNCLPLVDSLLMLLLLLLHLQLLQLLLLLLQLLLLLLLLLLQLLLLLLLQ